MIVSWRKSGLPNSIGGWATTAVQVAVEVLLMVIEDCRLFRELSNTQLIVSTRDQGKSAFCDMRRRNVSVSAVSIRSA